MRGGHGVALRRDHSTTPLAIIDGGPPASGGTVARLSRLTSLACLALSGLGLLAMTAIILWQVFARYVLNDSPSWSEQAALYLLVWTVLLAAAAGVRERFHIRIEAAQDALGGRARARAVVAAHLVTGLIGVFLAMYGTKLVASSWAYAIPTLGLPRGSALLPLPLAGVLIAAFSAEHVAALVRGRKVAPAWR